MPLLEAPRGYVLVVQGSSCWHEKKKRKSRKAREVPLKDKSAYTLSEVGDLLGVSRQTVNNLITIKRRQTSPLLRTIRVANTIRVTRHDLDTYILATRISAGIPTID